MAQGLRYAFRLSRPMVSSIDQLHAMIPQALRYVPISHPKFLGETSRVVPIHGQSEPTKPIETVRRWHIDVDGLQSRLSVVHGFHIAEVIREEVAEELDDV